MGLFMGERINLTTVKNERLEIFWSTFPALLLVLFSYFSLFNLYNIEVGDKVNFGVKVVGHQWYWEYRYETSINDIPHKEEFLNYLGDWLQGVNTFSFKDGWDNFERVFKGVISLFLKGDWF